MNLKLTIGEVPAGARHVATAIGTVVSMVGVLHLLPADQVAALKASIDKITDGFSGLWTVLGPIAMAAATKYAMKSATPESQAASLTQQIPGTVVVTSPELSKALPTNEAVVSMNDVKVVTK